MSALLLLGLGLGLVACGPKLTKPEQQIRRDYHCEEIEGSRQDVEGLGEVWVGTACGRTFRLRCPVGPHSRWKRCEYITQDQYLAATEGDAPSFLRGTPPEFAYSHYAQRHLSALRECVGARKIVVPVTPDGTVEAPLPWTDEEPGQRACVVAALGGGPIQPSIDARRFIVIDLESGDIEVTESVPEASDAHVERALRAGLDAHATDILACAGTQQLAVGIAWQTTAIPIVTLQGDLEGTPTQQCVRDVLEGVLSIPAGTSPGVILHLVRGAPADVDTTVDVDVAE